MSISPLPWTFDPIGKDSTGETYGELMDADGSVVAESIYQKDAEAIIEAIRERNGK